jgi:UDP-N-acetylmuramyl pentapeptide phosphotransferase/UDP-N-acetylglucosamine-1-phosphate transferase
MPGDLKGKHMLGDCGSNLLGFVLGCTMAITAPVWLQATGLFMLAVMHRTAERSSITAWIERHKWVRWLDRFGRA